jgi:hypothetical protein
MQYLAKYIVALIGRKISKQRRVKLHLSKDISFSEIAVTNAKEILRIFFSTFRAPIDLTGV